MPSDKRKAEETVDSNEAPKTSKPEAITFSPELLKAYYSKLSTILLHISIHNNVYTLPLTLSVSLFTCLTPPLPLSTSLSLSLLYTPPC